ncbi:hypothetical protein EV03_1617 [Prochlorococcus marinus str. PAC1]|uniref:Uncharacterized protein n=2 Tax=Prochlorococcus marinus TaxID=1219 RepID=A2C0M7_PROM1|nr:Hypothetical protein NATL1_04731 [Prochlorococcus marinus str. NATL1A]AIQ96595.1 hypothetical protein EW15_0503 [Prochlorococcus sp. MIT 0801]KGG19237.1 hypothetical protein EV03_1617 [Prochlorococcus marinus str. PAC1]
MVNMSNYAEVPQTRNGHISHTKAIKGARSSFINSTLNKN